MALQVSRGFANELRGKSTNLANLRYNSLKLRGQISEGLVYKMPKTPVGVRVTGQLGIKKYEPETPNTMNGELWRAGDRTLSFAIENIKLYPDVFKDGEIVVFTEKLHGTWACFGKVDGLDIVASKGYSHKGFALKTDEGVNDNNLYVRHFRKHKADVEKVCQRLDAENVYILGEIYGRGVQDLDYGTSASEFRVFDIYIGTKENGSYLAFPDMVKAVAGIFTTVPVVYAGQFSKAVLAEYTIGQSLLAEHIREGVVVRPRIEGEDDEIGRRLLKSVNEAYTLRRNKNRTEYQ